MTEFHMEAPISSDKTVSLFSWRMTPDLKIKKTEGREGQNEL